MNMWLLRSHFQCWRAMLGFAMLLYAGLPALAQDAPAQNAPAAKPPKPYGGGSPLNVILHTKFWETPPEAKQWVKESREPTSQLHFQSTAAVVDPHRPKVLNVDQLRALEGELEQAGAHNHEVATAPNPNDVPAPVAASKGKPRKVKKAKNKTKRAAAAPSHP